MKRAEAIDRIGQIDEEIAKLGQERERLMRKLEGREGTFQGLSYQATGYWKRSTWLDTNKVKRRLGVEALGKCFSSKDSFCVRVTALKQD